MCEQEVCVVCCIVQIYCVNHTSAHQSSYINMLVELYFPKMIYIKVQNLCLIMCLLCVFLYVDVLCVSYLWGSELI